MKTQIKNIICALALLAGALVVTTDAIISIFHTVRFWQYAFNALYFLLVLPACIAALDLPYKMHPEFYNREAR